MQIRFRAEVKRCYAVILNKISEINVNVVFKPKYLKFDGLIEKEYVRNIDQNVLYNFGQYDCHRADNRFICFSTRLLTGAPLTSMWRTLTMSELENFVRDFVSNLTLSNNVEISSVHTYYEKIIILYCYEKKEQTT